MNFNQMHLSMRFGVEAAIIFILLSLCLVPAIAQDSSQNSAAEEVLGSLLETVTVPSGGNPVYTTNVLEAGKRYIIQAPGVFSYWDGSTDGADAYYDYRDQGVDYRPLQIDGQSMYDIAKKNGDPVEYNPNHFYETSIVGSGKPLMLSIWDPGPYSDNHGSLEVKVYQGQPEAPACDRLLLDLEEGPNSVVIAKVVDVCEHKSLKDVRLEIRVFHTYNNQLRKAINGNYVDREPMYTDRNGEALIPVSGNLGDIYRVDVYASNGDKWDTSDRSIHVTIGEGATSPAAVLLASSWIVSERGPQGNYDGTWTRRPGTSTFDASWSEGSITDVIDITSVEGNRVTLHRHGNNGDYIGTISPNGSSISGTASWYAPGEKWSVSIGESF